MSLEDLVERSEFVLHARCLRSWSAWDEQKRVIWTHTELLLAESLKGTAATTIVVSEPGGMVGDVGMTVEGAPRYRSGEEVVVFLYRTPQGLLRTRGLSQGKFTLTGEERVRANVSRRELVSPSGGGPRGTLLEQVDGMGLPEFRNLVRSLALRLTREGR
jgi:hypothetical protein